MIKKSLLLILVLSVFCYGYYGKTHSQLMETVPYHLKQNGFVAEYDTVSKYLNLMMDGAKDPDRDYPQLRVPTDKLPLWLKPLGSTSVGKWEHTLIDDIPKEVDNLLKEIAVHFDIKYQYADEAVIEWLGIAKKYWNEGQIDSSMWHLARACHLIEDICVPMHCRVTGNLIDVWNILNHEQPNHNQFETYCMNYYEQMKVRVDLNDKFELPGTMQEIAKKSRKLLKYCDGVGKGCIFNAPIINRIFPWFVEDYDYAARISTQRAEEYTVKLVHYFFQSVK